MWQLGNWNPNPAAKIAGMASHRRDSLGVAKAGLLVFNYQITNLPNRKRCHEL
jgi:hypothetical protein